MSACSPLKTTTHVSITVPLSFLATEAHGRNREKWNTFSAILTGNRGNAWARHAGLPKRNETFRKRGGEFTTTHPCIQGESGLVLMSGNERQSFGSKYRYLWTSRDPTLDLRRLLRPNNNNKVFFLFLIQTFWVIIYVLETKCKNPTLKVEYDKYVD